MVREESFIFFCVFYLNLASADRKYCARKPYKLYYEGLGCTLWLAIKTHLLIPTFRFTQRFLTTLYDLKHGTYHKLGSF